MKTYSTLVVGAGAAGIAAGRALADAGYDALILEARNRIGGRIYTDTTFADSPVELGAEFIHGDNAVTHELVRQAGLSVIPVVRMDNLWWAEGASRALPRPLLPPELQARLKRLLDDYHRLTEADLPEDISLADYLRERGHEPLRMADVLLAQTCCAPIDSLGCYDIIREFRVDSAGGGEARIREGYSALLNWYSRELEIRYQQPVTEIQWSAQGVTVICGGETYAAKSCIVTVPVSVLQQGMIRFSPSLPSHKQWAIDSFRTEPASKLMYRFHERFWSDELTFMAHEGRAGRWWTPGYRRNTAIICAYVTANRARELDGMDEADALAVGLEELSRLLDVPLAKVNYLCAAAKRVSWIREPYTLGGYAHVPPRKGDCRRLLARSENGVLFFAGEATAYETNPQTVHGAIESGWRAAHECIASLTK